MTPIEIQELRDAIVAEALTWEGTPYHHMGDIKGEGVDCAMLLVRVYQALGIVPGGFDPRPYPPEWHLHRSYEMFRGWTEGYAHLCGSRGDDGTMEGRLPLPGELIVYKFGRCYSHGAIAIGDGMVIHSYLREGVVRAAMADDVLGDRPALYYTLWAEAV